MENFSGFSQQMKLIWNFDFLVTANNGSVVPGSDYAAYNSAPYQQYSTAYSYGGYNGTSGSLLSK